MERERWSVTHSGRLHEVFVRRHRFTTSVQWHVDGIPVGQESEAEKSIVVAPATSDDEASQGPSDLTAGMAIGVKAPGLFGATRRVVLHTGPATSPDAPPEESAPPHVQEDPPYAGDGEDDEDPASLPGAHALLLSFNRGTVPLRPDPGTPAARRQAWIRRHPHLHVLRETVTSGGPVLWGALWIGVVIPLLELLIPDVEGPSIDAPNLPDLPSIPWPDIAWPSFSWPDIPWPDIPWPDIQWPDPPDWWWPVTKLVVALTFAGFLARAEAHRLRDEQIQEQAAEQAAERDADGSADAGSADAPPRAPGRQ